MKIKWIGHSSFLLTTSLGRKILTDPFGNDIGYIPYDGDCDIITVSHNHFDHNCLDNLKKDTRLVNTEGRHSFNFCDITGYHSFHDESNGSERGDNIIFVYDVDGFRICHLGDLGHELSRDFIEQLGHIDLLLIPVGGIFTIDGTKAAKITKEINPSFVIPMHYSTPMLSFKLEGFEKFIMAMKNVNKTNSDTFFLEHKENKVPEVILLTVNNHSKK